MTKIVLCGANGKMGHTLAGCIAKREDCTVIAGIDSYTKQYDSFPIVETAEQLPEQPDVIIDFSNSSSLEEDSSLFPKSGNQHRHSSGKELSGKSNTGTPYREIYRIRYLLQGNVS